MSETFKVRITKDFLLFSSGHFITFDGDHCERVHGHNYGVTVDIQGPLDANHYVIDFIALRNRCKVITDELDHRMMLPTQSRYLQVQETPKSVHVRYRDREWVFPREDCVLLPVENTTAELLARYIGKRLLEVLMKEQGYEPEAMRVEVEETVTQSAVWEWGK